MTPQTIQKVRWSAAVAMLLVSVEPVEAQTLNDLIAGARKEPEMSFVAGPTTFGGRQAFAELQVLFNKKFGLNARINHTAGPSMPAMAARIITEAKAGRKSSTDVHLGPPATHAELHNEKLLERVDYAKTFPWVTKEMEILPAETVLVYTSLQGILYNSNLLSKDKVPKTYEDLIDPKLSQNWAGKMAIPPYTSWLVELSLFWGEKKVLDYLRKLLPLGAGQVRYGEIEERVSSGEFAVMANSGSAVEGMWEWQAKGAPLVGVTASDPVLTSYFQLGVPKNSAHPNLAKLFVAFMASPEAQRIVEKYEQRSSHLVEGTRMNKYVKENRLRLQGAAELISSYHEGKGLEFRAELTNMLKQPAGRP
ncbi:MAG TPA: ABC transporter substrate-binding protein [Candidatus Binatia bacterium]|nr:ABC transporter substrate-binding protein [Candidatus Binatia bacterium]